MKYEWPMDVDANANGRCTTNAQQCTTNIDAKNMNGIAICSCFIQRGLRNFYSPYKNHCVGYHKLFITRKLHLALIIPFPVWNNCVFRQLNFN